MAHFFILVCLTIVFGQTKAEDPMAPSEMHQVKASRHYGRATSDSEDKRPAIKERNEK